MPSYLAVPSQRTWVMNVRPIPTVCTSHSLLLDPHLILIVNYAINKNYERFFYWITIRFGTLVETFDQ